MNSAQASPAATEHYELVWRGITVRASYNPYDYGGPGEPMHIAHLQVANAARREPLPMTETGYKSLHLPFGEVEAAGGVVRYVTQWLDHAARKPEWKAIERDQQGSLF
jgi:hypothetical protein